MRNQGMSHLFRERLVIEIGENEVREMEQRAKTIFNEQDTWIEAVIKGIESYPHP